MNKKSFKDNTANIDRFFSEAPQPEAVTDTQAAFSTHTTQQTQITQEPQKAQYRINLRLRAEYREYLEHESWKAHQSITEYLNDLIQADMNAKRAKDTEGI